MNDEKAQATETPDSAASALSAGLGFDVALNVRHPDCHKAADAFWKYWEENGETHKHGYYESTWGAINAALRVVGVRPHDWSGVKPNAELSGPRPLAAEGSRSNDGLCHNQPERKNGDT